MIARILSIKKANPGVRSMVKSFQFYGRDLFERRIHLRELPLATHFDINLFRDRFAGITNSYFATPLQFIAPMSQIALNFAINEVTKGHL